MVAMTPQKIEGGEYLTVREAVEFMGCTEGWVRMLLGTGRLAGKRFGERAWMIPIEAARQARDNLSTRATARKHLAKRPAAKRKKSAKKKKK
jgi:hypothetical protein